MNTITKTAKLTLRIENNNAEDVFALGIELFRQEGDEIYFSECDGNSLCSLQEAFSHIARDLKIESNEKNEAWFSTWDNENLATLSGKRAIVEYTETWSEPDEEGDSEYIGCTAKLIELA